MNQPSAASFLGNACAEDLWRDRLAKWNFFKLCDLVRCGEFEQAPQ